MSRKEHETEGIPETNGAAASAQPEGVSEEGGTNGTERRPQRYKVYDRIADNVSVHTMNIIIAVVSVLLIVLLIYGIATGNPPQ